MLITHITDSLFLLFSVLISLAVLLGWGSLTKKLIGIPFANSLRMSDAWIGLVSVITFIETCHLWVPINWRLSAVVIVIGMIGLFMGIRVNKTPLHWGALLRNGINQKINPLLVVVGIFLLFTWTSLALMTPSIYDGGLYHFQAIRWLNEFPIVLGLGNLSGRLAFNQSYFPYLALLNIAPFFGKGYAVGGLLLIIMSACTLIEAQLNRIRGGWWLNLWIMIALINISRYLSSPSPDVAVVLIQVACFLFLIKVYSPKPEDPSETMYSAVMVFLLGYLLVTMKFSSVIFAAMAILLLLPSIKTTYAEYKKLYVYIFLLGVYLVSIHLLRGILLSGLPLYPSTLGALWNLDWSVTREQAVDEANWIYSWARDASKTPDAVLGSWAWLPAWAEQLMKDRWQYIYGVLLLVSADLFFILRSSQNYFEKRLFALFIPFVAAIIFWFFTAPDWRFLGAIPQLFIGISGWIFLQIGIPRSISTYTDKWPPYVAPSFVSIIVLVLMTKTADFKTLPLTGWRSIPKVEVVRKETNSNLPVWIPANGDQCWDSVLPCAPKLNEELHIRGTNNVNPESLKHGFSVRK